MALYPSRPCRAYLVSGAAEVSGQSESIAGQQWLQTIKTQKLNAIWRQLKRVQKQQTERNEPAAGDGWRVLNH